MYFLKNPHLRVFRLTFVHGRTAHQDEPKTQVIWYELQNPKQKLEKGENLKCPQGNLWYNVLHSDPKLKISFGNCCGKLRHFECLRGVLRRQKYVRLIFEKSFSGFRSLNC